jgi:hypothetical protein
MRMLISVDWLEGKALGLEGGALRPEDGARKEREVSVHF